MFRIIKKSLCVLLTLCLIVCTLPLTCFAAGKTVAGYKNTTYSGTADAYEMVYGVKNYVSSYATTYKEAGQVTQSDFYDKTKTIKYWAAHGTNAGNMWGTSNNVSINIFNDYTNFSWAGGNLEFVFLAACKQLDGLGNNPRAEYARAMIGNNAVRTICGYHEAAPSGIDDDIVRKFLEYAKTEESVKSSWILANTYYANLGYSTKDYLVLTHSGAVQYSRFEGFSDTTYSRPNASSTTILRFSSTGSNTQPTKLSTTENIYGLVFPFDTQYLIETDIPVAELSATETKAVLTRSSTLKLIEDENATSTVIKEVGHTPTSLSESDALQCAQKWFIDNFRNSPFSSTRSSNITITPIVMAEVNLDGGEEVESIIAYSVCQNNSFNGIPILGDHLNVIVDDEGAIYASVRWAEYSDVTTEALRTVRKNIAFTDAAKLVHTFLNNSERYQIFISDDSSAKDTIAIESAELVYAYNSDTSTYQPCWRFVVDGYSSILVNCFTGNIMEM